MLHAVEDGNCDIHSKVDHINPASWQGNVHLASVHPLSAWNEGREMTEVELRELKVSNLFLEIEKKGYNLLHPFGDVTDDDDGIDDSEMTVGDPLPTVGPGQSVNSLDEIPLGDGDAPDLTSGKGEFTWTHLNFLLLLFFLNLLNLPWK
jgi:hypothetical protein